MDIINNEATVQLRSELLSVIKENEKNIGNKVDETLNRVHHWKFASDEYFNLVPFYNELNNFKQGRLLKNIQENDRFSKPNIFSFGFDEGDNLLIVQNMMGKDVKLGVNTKLYEYSNPHERIDYFTVRYYPEKNFPAKLVSVGRFMQLDATTKIDMVAGSVHSWSVTYYFLENNRIIQAIRYAVGWNGQTAYDFIYENDVLNRIMVGETTWWTAK